MQFSLFLVSYQSQTEIQCVCCCYSFLWRPPVLRSMSGHSEVSQRRRCDWMSRKPRGRALLSPQQCRSLLHCFQPRKNSRCLSRSPHERSGLWADTELKEQVKGVDFSCNFYIRLNRAAATKTRANLYPFLWADCSCCCSFPLGPQRGKCIFPRTTGCAKCVRCWRLCALKQQLGHSSSPTVRRRRPLLPDST